MITGTGSKACTLFYHSCHNFVPYLECLGYGQCPTLNGNSLCNGAVIHQGSVGPQPELKILDGSKGHEQR
ncbi:hypothetical protein SERLA73DRAFT_130348 [Serpula lacrymans var. lacrymans S7.3]|uniref:Uncharacterized protein n=2 Tax=Serpula lacrymans var. lacrymans TaxID=341189 RepID=F8PKB2_SERL3|nr:uncharacterized protein SERLADRAFT_379127 [Serpula lacrymans var. lacrymans S7.9]EGO03826.1 hypothetical protein SERLA73DRAFT_130348 [Serpula lacrymans var. lacrymans S7.3]EGO29753.1 hypothetical protein SERLADRAFT_379127 [Serpula lacrymans var. lacrymans S7.9]